MSDSRNLRWTLAQSRPPCVLLCALIQLTGIGIISGKMSSLNRTQGDYVLLCPDSKIGNETLLIKWYFLSKNLSLLTIWSGESSPHWIIPQKEYKGRLSVPDGESLKITNLTPEDSGSYEAHIISVSGEIYIEKFNLTVFGTVTRKSNTNPWIWWSLLGSLVLLVAVWCFLCKVKSSPCKIKDILTRGNIQAVVYHENERRLEEGLTACPNGFHSDQETHGRHL
ncbi:SLAM family member 6-like isoform X2 [Phascolarctos cinereus]|nr:uncharacterized protein LOC110205507 isoform X2 [Phascolarctos cinereus]